MMGPRIMRASVLLVAAVILFSFLGARGLNEPDEGRYAEIAREMAATNEWLVPHLNGFEHFQKPPLIYWATGTSVKLFGANEWAARFPSALAALGTILLTLLIARMLWGDTRTEFFAALILMTMGGFFAMARLLTPDMMLTFWTTAAIACFVANRRRGPAVWGWLFFVTLGCGFLTKGPMAFVVPLSGVAGWSWARRNQSPRERGLPWLPGVALALGIGLSWFVAMTFCYPQTGDYFWHYELLQRFGSHAHGRTKPFWFFVPVLALGLMPWTFFLPRLAAIVTRRGRALLEHPPAMLLAGWLLLPLCALTLSGSKLATYILPLLPAIGLGLARVLATEESTRVSVPRLAAASTALWLGVEITLPHWNDALRQQASVRDLARRIEQRANDRTQIFACGVRAHGLEFYLRRLVMASEAQSDLVLAPSASQQQRLLPADDDAPVMLLERARAEHTTLLGLIRTRGFGAHFDPARWQIAGRAGDFLLIETRPSALVVAAQKD
jgi:4-amino-4-deoxy-L-arabinose transferase-like glycosyltransferase